MTNVRAVCPGGSLLIALAVAGCTPPPTSTVADVGPIGDSGPVAQPLVSSANGMFDLSCVGHVTVPSSTTMVSGSLHVSEFLSMAPITSNGIQVFTNNVVTDTCAAPNCTAYTTDSQGNIALTLPSGSWYAYRLAVSGQTAPVIAYEQPWVTMAGGQAPGYAFAPATISMVGMLFMRDFQASTAGSYSGRSVDCNAAPLSNVRARIFVGDTEVLSGALSDRTSPRITGLEGSSPTRTGLSGISGNFVGANIPPSDDSHVETWATLTDGALPTLIGCAEGRVLVGGITLAQVGPLRSDYPAGSRCAIAAAAAMH
jgi:hypothetical protein